MKVAFFDRDGTIIEDYPDEKWTDIQHPVFIEGAIQTLQEVQGLGYKIIIITNQYIINEGFITQNQYDSITNQLLNELNQCGVEIFRIYYCPHAKREGCSCMKPRTGMIRQALVDYPHISLADSFMVGDSIVDIELAMNMEMKGFGINVEHETNNSRIKKISKVEELLIFLKP